MSSSRSDEPVKPKRIKKGRFIGCLVAVLGLTLGLTYALKQVIPTSYPSPLLFEVLSHEWEEMPTITEWKGQEVRFAYLTFDDGPSRNTPAILDILASYDIKATFFPLGSSIERLENSEELLNQMLEAGHYLGLHSMTQDPATLYKSDQAVENFMNEMTEEQALIESLTGFKSNLCRAPYGTAGMLSEAHVEAIVESGLKCWDWDIDAWDWSYTNVSDILAQVETGLTLSRYPSQLVVLFHEKDITPQALPLVIDRLTELGYEMMPYDPENHLVKNLLKNPDL